MQAGEAGWGMLACCMGEVGAGSELERVEPASWLLRRGPRGFLIMLEVRHEDSLVCAVSGEVAGHRGLLEAACRG